MRDLRLNFATAARIRRKSWETYITPTPKTIVAANVLTPPSTDPLESPIRCPSVGGGDGDDRAEDTMSLR